MNYHLKFIFKGSSCIIVGKHEFWTLCRCCPQISTEVTLLQGQNVVNMASHYNKDVRPNQFILSKHKNQHEIFWAFEVIWINKNACKI